MQHVENYAVHVACRDLGAVVGAHLALPLLRERLDAHALAYAVKLAEQAQQEVMRMEVRLGSLHR